MALETKGFPVPFPGFEQKVAPPGSVCLLVSPPGVGKSVFAQTLAAHALRLLDQVIFVAFDNPVDEIKSSVKKFLGEDLDNRFSIVDFYDNKISSISDVGIEINKAVQGQSINTWLVVDSLSTLGILNTPDNLPPWLLDMRRKLKLPNLITFFNYATGVNPPALTANLQILCDGTLEMKMEEDESGKFQRLFRIYSFRNSQHTVEWFPFNVQSDGVHF